MKTRSPEPGPAGDDATAAARPSRGSLTALKSSSIYRGAHAKRLDVAHRRARRADEGRRAAPVAATNRLSERLKLAPTG